jgi:hypothetical protein
MRKPPSPTSEFPFPTSDAVDDFPKHNECRGPLGPRHPVTLHGCATAIHATLVEVQADSVDETSTLRSALERTQGNCPNDRAGGGRNQPPKGGYQPMTMFDSMTLRARSRSVPVSCI